MPLFGGGSAELPTLTHIPLTPRVVIATTVGISLSALFSGSNYALTYIALPSLLLPAPSSTFGAQNTPDSDTPKAGTSPAHLARQWQRMLKLGQTTLPVAAIGSAGAFIFAVLQLPEKGLTAQKNLYITAATLVVMIAPFTRLFMKGTDDELQLRADAATKDGESEESHPDSAVMGEAYQTQGLITYWGGLNVVRANLSLASIACAAAALVW